MTENIDELISKIHSGDTKALARAITLVENELNGWQEILASLKPAPSVQVIGITGPPGAGKSTLINALISGIISDNKSRVAVVAVDPTSPFNFGSLLGDRLRMSEHFSNDRVYIRSLATRGSLGGLSEKTLEVTDVIRAAGFNYIIVETVGVGQSEVEVAGLADTTIVTLVPESGDYVQTIKSGVMEIADIFVVNKSDREGAEAFENHLKQLVGSRPKGEWEIPVIKTTASAAKGITGLLDVINKHAQRAVQRKRPYLLAEKAYRLIAAERMKDIDRKKLLAEIETEMGKKEFNLYAFVRRKIKK